MGASQSGRFVALALVLGLLAGCAGMHPVDPVTVSADTAAIVGEQAVTTNTLYVQLCAQQAVPADKCAAWTKFFLEFKKNYAVAHAAYKQAIAVNDVKSAQDAAKIIQALSNQLVLYYIYSQGEK